MTRSGETPSAATSPGSTPSAEPRVKQLEDERERLLREVADLRDRLLRSRADYDNQVKRSARETEDRVRFAKAAILVRVASLVETLQDVRRHVPKDVAADLRGLDLLLDEGRRILADHEVHEIPAVGKAFNVRLHQAVERHETTERPEGTVLDVIRPGYQMGDEVLRPALVRVATAPKGESGSPAVKAKA